METKENLKEVSVIILASLVLALIVAFKNKTVLFPAIIIFFIILTINTLTKKSIGYYLETKIKTKLWSIYQYEFRKDRHFKKPLPMIWLPLFLTLITRGFFLWLGILEFDVEAKTERVSKRHGLYRFTQVTEWHMAIITIWALSANLIFAIIGYIAGFELFTKLSIYFIAWSTIPIPGLDGSKIFFSNRTLWATIFTIAMLLLAIII